MGGFALLGSPWAWLAMDLALLLFFFFFGLSFFFFLLESLIDKFWLGSVTIFFFFFQILVQFFLGLFFLLVS